MINLNRMYTSQPCKTEDKAADTTMANIRNAKDKEKSLHVRH